MARRNRNKRKTKRPGASAADIPVSGPVTARALRTEHAASASNSPPLTNHNLQQFLHELSEPQSPAVENGAGLQNAVVLDMDRYTRDQQNWRPQYAYGGLFGGAGEYHDDEMYGGGGDHALDSLSLAFGELNPSLDHLLDLTSLDDVCFPDYYDGLHHLALAAERAWPDLAVLAEFVRDEADEAAADAVDFKLEVDGSLHANSGYIQAETSNPFDQAVNFDHPVRHVIEDDVSPSTETAPLLGVEQRPRPIQPWQKLQQHLPTVPGGGGRDELCRFTYFRDDMSGTLHLATLLGLVAAAVDSGGNSGETAEAGPEPASTLALLQLLFGVDAAAEPPLSVKSPSPPPASEAMSVSGLSHPFWLDVLDPLEEEMKVLAKTFGLHPLTTEDIFLGEAREKVELFRQYYFVCFTSFDVVYERRKQRAKEQEKKLTKLQEFHRHEGQSWVRRGLRHLLGRGSSGSGVSRAGLRSLLTISRKEVRNGELLPLNMYMIVFPEAVLTFHFGPTPHPINVRRRARMLREHLTVLTDWICYALIDDITDSFAPLVESIEREVYLMEDEIMRIHDSDLDLETDDSDVDDKDCNKPPRRAARKMSNDVFFRRQRSKLIVEAQPDAAQNLRRRKRTLRGDRGTFFGALRDLAVMALDVLVRLPLRLLILLRQLLQLTKVVAWKRKGDMLRRIGECRKRAMSVMRLLGSKADVIRGFSKRFSENEAQRIAAAAEGRLLPAIPNPLTSRLEILMYMGDIQDHVVTMVQLLNHYEKLLARSHLNYLAQINIDMTKVNNDTNDVLGKLTILGTIVLPINVVTGLWGMNCIVPGQEVDSLQWFYGILVGISLFSMISYLYAKHVTGL